MIVYGWNHFSIKSYKPINLGIPYDGEYIGIPRLQGYTITVYKCFAG